MPRRQVRSTSKPLYRRFTKRVIESLPYPAPGQAPIIVNDEHTPGLAVRVSATGRRTFFLRRKVDGRPERVTIGPFPSWTVEQARARAAELNAEFAGGRNPAAARRAQRLELTFQDLFDRYLDQHIRAHGKAEKNPRSYWNRYLSRWAGRRLGEITRREIRELHQEIARDTGGANANRVLVLIRAMFNRAIAWEIFAGDNPATRIDRFPERSRERYLQPEELPAFFAALRDEPNADLRDFFLLALMTGARRANLLAMRWEEISFNAATWRIPKTKSGDPHVVPLVPEAVRILEARARGRVNEWVFPGGGRAGHMVEPKRGWKRIIERAGIENLRIHDLRRTLGSWQAAGGVGLHLIGRTLAHRSLATTQVYARLDTDPIRAAIGVATDAMLTAGKYEDRSDEH